MSDSEKPKSSWWEIITNCCVSIDRKCKPTERRFDQCAILNILGHAGRPVAIVTIIIAMIVYLLGGNDRQRQAENQRKAKQYQAWQVISAAQGKPGDLGRTIALQDLHRDGISLAGVDISKATLKKLNLEKADLSEAILSEAILIDANFSGANFHLAKLCDTDLHDADLSDANLPVANLYKAYLPFADLSDANLWFADLSNTDLRYADLSGAILKSIRNWQCIDRIKNANIYDVKDAPEGFIEWATAPEQGAVRKDKEEWKKFISEKKQEQTKEKQ